MKDGVPYRDKFLSTFHHNDSAGLERVNHLLHWHQRFRPTKQNKIEPFLAELVFAVANGGRMQCQPKLFSSP